MATSPITPELNADCDRAAINRENAQHSTGPRTVEGKQRVRMNALKHGLYSQALIVHPHEQEAYDQDFKTLEARYRPINEQEAELVQSLHEYRWRFNCSVTLERNLHRLTEEDQLEAIDERFGEQDEEIRRALAQAAGYRANTRMFDQLSRLQARLERILDRTYHELSFVIANRPLKRPVVKATEQSQTTWPSSPAVPAEMPEFTGSLKEFKRKQWLRQQEKRNNPQSGV